MKKGYLRVKEAATYLGVSEQKIYREIQNGTLKAMKFGNEPKSPVLIPIDSIEKALRPVKTQ